LDYHLRKSICELEFWDYFEFLQQLIQQECYEEFFEAIYYRCAEDIEIFAVCFFPHYCKFPFNVFHFDTFRNYEFGERGIRRADAAPRGFAKSTIKVLIKPIHDHCYKLEKFIVILSYNEAQSAQKLKDISSEFLTNEALRTVYGRFLQGRKVNATDFVASNGDHSCRFLALGSGTEMRGIRYRDARPSKIILDDIEHSTEVENELLRDKVEAWYMDVVSKIGDEETNIEIVGTILHERSLLKTLINNPRYSSREYKAIISWADRRDLWDQWTAIYVNLDDDNRLDNAKEFYLKNEEEMMKGVEVLWPEKEPYYRLQEEIIETGIRSFMKEKQNSPMSDEEKIFTPESIWWYKEVEHGFLIEKTNVLIPWQALTAVGSIDPSTGQRKPTANKKPDFTCIPAGYMDMKKRLFVDSDFTKRVPPSEFIKKIFELNEQYQFYKFAVETNLFRNLLLDNIRSERDRRKAHNIKWADVELHENKEKRIYSLEPKVFHGHILFNRDKISTEFMNQLYDFPKAVHDDCPDALEMLWGLVQNKYKIGALNSSPMNS
jgi:predicted phage terminase large subunit-like protein